MNKETLRKVRILPINGKVILNIIWETKRINKHLSYVM